MPKEAAGKSLLEKLQRSKRELRAGMVIRRMMNTGL
jgi:hypothetical protein